MICCLFLQDQDNMFFQMYDISYETLYNYEMNVEN